MKKATTKILLAALSLVMALGIATGSTFAWFTSNRTVTVGAVEAQVVSGTQGLYVAVKDASTGNYGEFKTALATADIMTALFGANYTTAPTGAVKLDALTSADNGVTLKNEANTTATAFSNTADDNTYLEFTLKFRTTVAQDIYLGFDNDANNSTITAGTAGLNCVKAWDTIAADAYGNASQIEKNQALDTRAAYAARVAFITGGAGQVWAPYDYTTGNNDGYNTQAGFYKGNLAKDYRDHLLGTNTPVTATNLNAVKLELDSDAAAGNVTTGATKIVTTTDNTAGAFDAEVTIRLWIEGTDGDCLNTIFNDILTLNLVFNSVVPAAVNP